MTTIDWDTIPDWVNYIATDKDGATYYYEEKPTVTLKHWVAWGRIELASANRDWTQTLVSRP